jgi:arginyl-tRNA synthetase
MVCAGAKQAGWLPGGVVAEHVGFGMLLGEDGKRFRTRAGGTVKLIDLVTEAVERAARVVEQRSDLSETEQAEVARQVGTGAVKYADLSSDRERDYTFAWSRMLTMEGNTSVYLQYANARIQSVLRRAARDGHVPMKTVDIVLTEPAERALALSLDRFAPVVTATAETLSPHRLCGQLYELATAFSKFYENCSIVGAESDEIRASRLRLAELTSRTLTQGLWLLGIEAPARL